MLHAQVTSNSKIMELENWGNISTLSNVPLFQISFMLIAFYWQTRVTAADSINDGDGYHVCNLHLVISLCRSFFFPFPFLTGLKHEKHNQYKFIVCI